MPRGNPTISAGPKISALFKGPGGQNPDTTRLPPEHEIQRMDEAREYYTSELPIFLMDSKSRQKTTANNACLALEGQTGAYGDRVSVTTRFWCDQHVYQTIDLNKQRIIVKFFKGVPGGGFYRRWMGVIEGFEKQPIAFPVSGGKQDLVTSDAKPAIVRKRKSKQSRMSESDSNSSEAEFIPPRKKSVHTSSLREKRSRDLEKESPIATTNGSCQVDQPLDLARAAATMNPPSKPALSYASAASSAGPALQVKVKKEPGISSQTPYVTPVQPANTSSVRSQAQISHKNTRPPSAPSSSCENVNREAPQPKQPRVITSFSKAAEMSDEYEDLVANFISSPLIASSTTTTTASSSGTNVPQAKVADAAEAAPPPAPILLSPEKQQATILSVYLNQDGDYVPLYLRSCMTLARFFQSCLGAFELADQPEQVLALRVRLDHNATTTTGAVANVNAVGTRQEVGWLVKRNVPDSFDIFLEAVNKWAGWQDRDICDVRVDIMLRAR